MEGRGETGVGRALAVGLWVPLGVALAVGLGVAQVAPPVWRAGGAPYVLGYAKNVEWLAVSLGFWAGAATALLAGRRRLFLACGALALLGGALAAHLVSAPASAPLLPLRSALVYVATAVALALWDPLRPAPAAPAAGTSRSAVGAALLLLGALTFVGALRPFVVDPFHHGGMLSAALSLLGGEHPYRDFILAHGLHDAGVGAAWIALTGKIGTSPVALTSATGVALGALAVYLLGRRLVGPGLGALAGTYAAVLALSALGATLALQRLGMSVFVILALACSARITPAGTLLMGVALGCGHLFRLENALFGLVAAAGLLLTRHLAGAGARAARLRALTADAALLGLGVLLPLALSRLVLGWPDAIWFTYVLRTLPAYHVDSDGLRMPWPVGHWTLPPTLVAAGVLLLALAWMTTAARALRGLGARAAAPATLRRVEAVVFIALFAYGALRAALGRSDPTHVLRWGGVPLFAAGWLLLAAPLAAAARHRRAAWGGVALAAVGLALAGAPRLATLRAHLAPNPPAGACGDRMLTAVEAALPANRALLDDQCAVEALLRARGIERLVIDHSAPWYYLRFGLRPPTRFYMLGKAFTPALQGELVDHLRAARPQALLQVRAARGLAVFDVENAFRIPVAEAYLRERRRDAPRLATPLGTLLLLDAADGAPAAAPAGDAASEAQHLAVDRVRYNPNSGFLQAEGWAADVAAAQPATRVVAVVDGGPPDAARGGLSRPHVVAAFGGDAALRASGFSVVTRVPTAEWPARGVRVHAQFADGRTRSVAIDPARATLLPVLRHPDWADLEPLVAAAEQRGRADRAAALPAARQP